ncbi:MAG: HU family DNA-binding protein [Candidatus Paceibacterota bacterium]
MAKINKSDFVEMIYDEIDDCTKADAKRVMESIVDTITDTLANAEEVSIAGLGIFKSRIRQARTARNPQTGEEIQVPKMRVPKFRPAKALKEAVKDKRLDLEE